MKMLLKQYLPIILLLLWTGLFTGQIYGIYKVETSLQKITERLDAKGHELGAISQEILATVDQIHHGSGELQFLQAMFNFLPETERHIRPQKALFEEVQGLRKKINQWLKGRVHILIDTKTNKLYLKEGMHLLFEADCSVGRGGIMTDKRTGRRWEFVTPKGKFKILDKVENPVWTKPDWAFVETGEPPPPPDDPKRRVPGELGAYLLNLGDGYLIHGTKNEELLGRPASHGCVRLGAENLKNLYDRVPVGTEVYIY